MQEVEEERGHDRGDRDPEDRPGMPAMREPMSTEPRTTIGWMPTAPCMIRGCRTFMTTQPADAHDHERRQEGLGWRTAPRGPVVPTTMNGPKNGIAMSTPAATDRQCGQAESQREVRDRATAK
jgi:hypothetical protein